MPVRSQGSRWICHKRKVLQRVVDMYEAYLNHLSTLVEDHSIINSSDRARPRGYVQKWKQAKMLIGAAMYVDVLKFSAYPFRIMVLTLSMGSSRFLVQVRPSKQWALACQEPLLWPTVQLVCNRLKEEDGHKSYQGSALSNYSPAVVKQCADAALSDIKRLEEKLRARLEWSDTEATTEHVCCVYKSSFI